MAISGAKIFGCPACGFRVTHGDDACPRCNNRFTSLTMFECPFCGELIDPSGGSCPSCHVKFDDFRDRTKDKASEESIDSLLSDIIRLESFEVRQEDKRLSCPGCSWLLNGMEESCPKCGISLVDKFSFQCPVCGETVDREATKCPECGANFIDDLPPAQPTEVESMKQQSEVAKTPDEVVSAVASAQEPKKPKQRKLRTRANAPPTKKA